MSETVRALTKYSWGLCCLACLCSYTTEFVLDQHRMIPNKHKGINHVAIIFIYVFILLLSIFGGLSAFFDSRIMSGICAFSLGALVCVDFYFIGMRFCYIVGQLTCGFGFAHTVVADGGGGGGKSGKK